MAAPMLSVLHGQYQKIKTQFLASESSQMVSSTNKQIAVQLKRIIKERYSKGYISRKEDADKFSEGVRKDFNEEKMFQLRLDS